MYKHMKKGPTNPMTQGGAKIIGPMLGLVCLSLSAPGSETYYEIAVERACEQAGVLELTQNALDAERAYRAVGAAVPNPHVYVEHEALDGDVGEVEESTIGVSAPVDHLWKRGARAASAQRRGRVAILQAEGVRMQIREEVGRLLLEHAHAAESLALIRSTEAALLEARVLAEAHVTAGVAAPSSLHRVEMSIEKCRLEAIEWAAIKAGAETRLRVATGWEAEIPQLGLEVDIESFGTVEAAVARAQQNRPDFLVTVALAEVEETDLARTRREALPEASVDLAYKRNNADQAGAFLGLTVELPLFKASRAENALALTQARGARLEVTRAKRTLEAEVAAAFQRWQGLQKRVGERSAPANPDFGGYPYVETVRAAFGAGEASLLELLDAMLTAADHRRSRLDYAHRLRSAAFELATVTATIPRFTSHPSITLEK